MNDMVHQKCALCSTVLDLGPESTFAQTYEATMSAHHAVCPKRPIWVEDRVRVVRTTTDRLHGALGVVVEIDHHNTEMPYRVRIDGDSYEDGWWCYEVERIAASHDRPIAVGDDVEWSRVGRDLRIIGRLVEMAGDRSHIHIEVREQHGKWPYEMVGNRQRCDGPLHKTVALRRIPRPAEAQTMVYDCTACGRTDATTADVCVRCHGSSWTAPRPAKTVVEQAQARAAAQRPTGGVGLRRDPSHVEDAIIKERYAEPPAPALVDGLPIEVCAARWWENRFAVEGGAAPPNVLTPAQLTAGRAAWLAGPGAYRSAALRAKVAASAEAERNRVTYCELDPCD